mmetsp:Transcript_8467/g.16138  ORF Transcript_8467/g.16138 Transcript_8467/m.16138 type:complete len:366 (+) Transcript_8467:26-1123(+)
MEEPEPNQARNYVFEHTLGQGSFGKVKLAVNTETGEKVAVKIVNKATIADVEDVERVFRETFILTTLKHPNIIKLQEVFDTPDAIMLAMEYAGGGELNDILEAKPGGLFSEVEAHSMFKQIVAGVEYCHRAKIIHRDLKLENILLDSDGNVKIADFGLSNTIKFGQKMTSFCGTPAYTSPEQIECKDYVGSAADVWSMGVILFNLVCGFLPFEARSLPELFWKVPLRLFKFPSYISKEVADLIDKMLQIDPEERITLGGIRNHPWFLMDYSDLFDRLSERGGVSSQQVQQGRNACLKVATDYSKKMAQEEAARQQAEKEQQQEAYWKEKARQRRAQAHSSSNSSSNSSSPPKKLQGKARTEKKKR